MSTATISGGGVLSRRYDLPVFRKDQCVMDGAWGPSPPNRHLRRENGFHIKDLKVQPHAYPTTRWNRWLLPYWQNKKIAVATDLGHTNQQIINTLRDADLLKLESNHDEEMLKRSLSLLPEAASRAQGTPEQRRGGPRAGTIAHGAVPARTARALKRPKQYPPAGACDRHRDLKGQ